MWGAYKLTSNEQIKTVKLILSVTVFLAKPLKNEKIFNLSRLIHYYALYR